MRPGPETVLVAGAAGLLGRTLMSIPFERLRRVAATRRGSGDVPGEASVQMDITSPAEVDAAIGRVGPRWVINAAAQTGVDACETDPEGAYRVHVGGTANLLRACAAAGSGLITLSTNYVFDGTQGIYREDDAPNPLNVYGRTKLASERLVLDAPGPGIVVRTAVLYGYRAHCRPNFATWAAASLSAGRPIRVVTDEWANPTYVDELAHFLLSLCTSESPRLVHFAGAEYLTRYGMVQHVCDVFGLDLCLVSPLTSAQLAQAARRPLRAGLCADRAERLPGCVRRPFRHNLELVLKDIGDLARLRQGEVLR